MTITHTAGPWQPSAPVTAVTDSHGLLVAECWVGSRPNEECQANARIISAAPDMLAMLQALRYYIARMEQAGIETAISPATVGKRMDELILKATGTP
jgi:hypothetical protein